MESMEVKLKYKNVLVTGGTGFVGSHLVARLIEIGANVVVISRTMDAHKYFYEQQLDKKARQCLIDIENYEAVLDVITKNKIEYVFHLAAQPLVDVAIENPRKTLYTNILGTINVLEACRIHRPMAIVVASSDKAYGKLDKEKYIESDPLRGDHPYDVSKTCTDLIAQTYVKSYDLPITILRGGNIYGEGDLNFSRIIPALMKSVIDKTPLLLRSNGKQVRDYVYVKDTVGAYILLASEIEVSRGEAFNLNTDDSFSVLGLIALCEKYLKVKVDCRVLDTAKNEIPYQALNSNKIRRLLGYESKYELKTVIKDIFEWYQNNTG